MDPTIQSPGGSQSYGETPIDDFFFFFNDEGSDGEAGGSLLLFSEGLFSIDSDGNVLDYGEGINWALVENSGED